MSEATRTGMATDPNSTSIPDLIGVVDTMFASYDMGGEAMDALLQCSGHGTQFNVLRRTVPGLKDLAVAAKTLIEEHNCRIVIALGMAGKGPHGKQCAHEASRGIMQAQLMTNTHILEGFIHEDQDGDPTVLAALAKSRSRSHALSAYALIYEPDTVTAKAGQGIR